MKHTPTPWKKARYTENGLHILESDAEELDDGIWIGDIEKKENALHIVKCVNAYDDALYLLNFAYEVLEKHELLDTPHSDGSNWVIGRNLQEWLNTYGG